MDLVMAAPTKSSSPHRIKVKKEVCSEPENIKDFAETAMNDILGWYGYGDSVDRIDIALSSSTPAPAVGSESNRSSSGSNKDNDGTSKGSSTMKSKHNKAQQQQQHKPRQFNMRQHNSSELSDTIASVAVIASGVPSPSASLAKTTSGGGSGSGGGSAGGSTGSASTNNECRSGGSTISNNNNNSTRNGVNLHHHGESSTSEKDSSRESSKSPMLVKMLDKQEPICQWCRRGVPPNQTGILGTTEGTIFCSESCFSQSRRASFKRAKMCDWCRHVRHAVSYVDFQDGVTQLQFCSDKCLNQYKMQIFCNETQAHLDMNPHLKEKSVSTGSLITPDLWLKNCKSRSISPASDRSESISPAPSRPSPEPSPVMLSPPVKKPLISVAPPSKLLSKNLQAAMTRSVAKSNRKRRSGLRPHQQAVLHCRRNSNSKVNFPQGNNNNNSNVLNNNLNVTSSPSIPKAVTSIGGNVQDLRSSIVIPKLSHPTKFENRDASSTPRPQINIPSPFLPNATMRHPFFPPNPAFRYGSPPSPQNTMPPPPPLNNPLTNLDGSNRQQPSLLGLSAPPVTILVPYPIVIPLPLPIPIPIPLIDFLKATVPKTTTEPGGMSDSPSSNTVEFPINFSDTREAISEAEPDEDIGESPLDFTIVNHEQRRQREVEQVATTVRASSVESYSLEAMNYGERNTGVEGRSPEQKLPKFKITRVNTRLVEGESMERTTNGVESAEQRSTKDSDAESREMVERSRPLRKRKRLVVHHEEASVVGFRESDSGDAKG
ncbi:sine oculis-binding protein homolog [Topomyia yanbarensis]|uniref:sine oculis-binding protein homolog n=1 Tax=Topomyia yanbarensis TaxID=2498891 RepID=UPI00273A923E|nr:sine oculis-binding protein homolog [Topomyia yanbarensis]